MKWGTSILCRELFSYEFYKYKDRDKFIMIEFNKGR